MRPAATFVLSLPASSNGWKRPSFCPRTVVIKMKTSKHQIHTRQITPPTLNLTEFADIAAGLISDSDLTEGLRLLGAAAANLVPAGVTAADDSPSPVCLSGRCPPTSRLL